MEMSLCFAFMVATLLFLMIRGTGHGLVVGVALFMLSIFLFYCAKIVNDGFQKVLFVSFTALHTASCMSLLTNIIVIALDAQKDLFITVLILIAVYVLGGWVMCRCFLPILRQVESRNMKWLWSVPAVFFFVSERLPFAGDPVHLGLFLIFLFTSFAVCVLLLRILDGVVKNVRLEANAEVINRQLDLQRNQYERLMKNAENVKFMHHDLRHHLTLMGELAHGMTKLEEYIKNLSEKLSATQEKFYCANYAVNAVASHYLAAAESEGVSVEARLEIPEDTGLVPAIDLCVIMGNFLENALEACRRIKHGNKFIRVRSRVAGDSLSIAVANSFDGLWQEGEQEGVYLSLKAPEREGIGLSSVRAVCEKHHGLAQYEIAGDVWKSSALVHME
jgi:hypothetical protein